MVSEQMPKVKGRLKGTCEACWPPSWPPLEQASRSGAPATSEVFSRMPSFLALKMAICSRRIIATSASPMVSPDGQSSCVVISLMCLVRYL